MESTILIFCLQKAAEAFGTKAATIIITDIGRGIAERISGDLFRTSVEEICERVQKIIEESFFNRDLASSRSITRLFFEAASTKDYDVLTDLYRDSDHIIEQLMSKVNSWEGYLATVQLMSVALLIIASLREKPNEGDTDYYKTYHDVLLKRGKLYAEWAIPKAEMIVQIAQDSVSKGVGPYYPTPFAHEDYYAYEKECPIDKTKACYRFQFEFYDTWASGMSLERRGDPYYHISKFWNGTVLTPSLDIKEPEFKKARMDAIQNAAKKERIIYYLE